MNESDLWTNYIKPGMSPFGDFVRIENTLESGTPDVNYAVRGAQGWVELKVVRSGSFKLERFQLPWITRRLNATFNNGVWMIIWEAKPGMSGQIFLMPARSLTRCPMVTTKDGEVKISMAGVRGPTGPGIESLRSYEDFARVLAAGN